MKCFLRKYYQLYFYLLKVLVGFYQTSVFSSKTLFMLQVLYKTVIKEVLIGL